VRTHGVRDGGGVYHVPSGAGFHSICSHP
jgi:hypothetical protein